MCDWQNLSHVRWDCKYHVIVIPKYRQKVFYGRMRKSVGNRRQKGSHPRPMIGAENGPTAAAS